MRRTVFAFVLMSIAGTAHAQLVPLPPTVAAVPVIPAYSNSVIDHEGNVLIFDVFYSYAAQSANQALFRIPIMSTHVTVITSKGESKKGFDFDGSLQVVGTGRRAVYAIVNSYTVNGTISLAPPVAASSGGTSSVAVAAVVPLPITVNRRLVALSVIAGTLPSTLPEISPLGSAEVKVAAPGLETDADSIALIESPLVAIPVPLAPTAAGTAPSVAHAVRLFTFDGRSFKEITKDRIVVP